MTIAQFRLIIVVALLALYGMDSRSQTAQNHLSDAIAVGLPLYAAAASYAHDDTQGLYQLIESEAATLVLTEALKSRIHETRPNGVDDKSFPSEHASIAFAAAQYLQIRGGWDYGVPAYALATYASYLRVDAKEHYWRDVVAGAALGMSMSYTFTDDPSRQRLSFSWRPGGAAVQWQKPLP